MKKLIGFIIVVLLLLMACSTKKDTFVNRTYHNVTSKYNVLYNGNIALEKGIQELDMQYEDNFWEVLPIEALAIDEESFVVPGEGEKEGNSNFDIAERKAVKTVQKHGMYIVGEERNKQIDDAYFLLGKARYYSQRFVPALEAFEYVIDHYPNGDLNMELRIWKAKAQIRLQNESYAIHILENILKVENLDKKIKEESHTSLAMAYMALDSTSLVMEHLKSAVKTDENTKQHARNLFILGQLYSQKQAFDSAQLTFQQLLDFKKAPYKYKIHSYLEKVKNSTDSTDITSLQKEIDNLIKERENRPYLDELYYQAAQLNFKTNEEAIAVENLEKSVHAPMAKRFQKGLSYENLGNYYFDKANFVKAGAYYDSVMSNVSNQNTKRVRSLKRKRKSLEEVITYETILKQNDSIFNLVNMSDDLRRDYFENYISKLKKADEIEAIRKENEARNKTAGNAFASTGKDSKSTGKWYFYSPQTVGFGKAEFQKIWGTRELEDYWRLSVKDNNPIVNNNTSSPTEILDKSKRYNADYYMAMIPTEEDKLLQMREGSSDALYQLGIIYKEQFKEYPLAIQRFERFLSENPKTNLILPVKYHLFKIYKETEDARLNQIKKEIVNEYPDSRFASIILNPGEATKDDDSKTPEKHYEDVYCDFEYERYTQVITKSDDAIKQYADDPIQAKFELLKAYALLKTNNKEAFKKGLEFIVTNYPKTVESEHAQKALDLMNGVKKSTVNKPNPVHPKNLKTPIKAAPLSDKEKKEKVLELMKKKGMPGLREDDKKKSGR